MYKLYPQMEKHLKVEESNLSHYKHFSGGGECPQTALE